MRFVFYLIIFFNSFDLIAQNNDDPIDLDFTQLDELTSKLMYGDKLFLDSQKLMEYINIDRSYLPQYTDEEFRKQMALIPTTIPLVYNEEIGILIKYFMFKRREYVTRMLTHAQYYFPKFEDRLDSRNMPIELKVLPIVESALNANARSRVGATGLWQIMHSTAQTLDLNINTMVDERSDPDLSTEAALTYLTKLYILYNDWLLALAAYNSGPGRVNRAIREAGGVHDFWRIRKFLPRETKNYVPSFIAMVYVMHYHNVYLLSPAQVKIDLHKVSTQKVYDQVSLKYIAELLSEDEELLKYLNPSLKKAIIPKTEEGFDLKIPVTKESVFLSKLTYLSSDPYINKVTYADNSESSDANDVGEVLESPDYRIIQKQKTHKVKKNETLQSIARKYNATVGELRKWNNLSKKRSIKSGSMLHVFVDVKIPNTKSAARVVNQQPAAQKTNTQIISNEETKVESNRSSTATSIKHIVKRGENLHSIAVKYKCTINDLKSWNQLSNSRLNYGQKLVIQKESRHISPQIEPQRLEETQTTKKEQNTYFYHIIKSGETLYSIARKYTNVSVSDLFSINHFSSDTKLSIGDKVKVPIF